MPDIKLNGPAVVNGAIRYPTEGLITVNEVEADRLERGGFLDLDDDDDLADEKVADLKKIATEESIDLGDATTKAAIIAAIRAHRAANPSE